MADEQYQEPKAPLAIRAGKVIATAGMVVGAAALGVAALSATGLWGSVPTIDPTTGADVAGKGIAGVLQQSPEWVHKAVESVGLTLQNNPNALNTAMLGAGVGVGGYALGAYMNKKEQQSFDAQDAAALDNIQQGGFVAAEQARAIQGQMKARLLATHPEYFAQGAGRGA